MILHEQCWCLGPCGAPLARGCTLRLPLRPARQRLTRSRAAGNNDHKGAGKHNPSENGSVDWKDSFPSYMQSKDKSSFCHDWEVKLQEEERRKTDADRRQGLDRSVVSHMNPVWKKVRVEAETDAQSEPMLSSFLYASILSHKTFEQSLSFVLANRLADATLLATELMDVFSRSMQDDHCIGQSAMLDLVAVRERDPSCTAYAHALVFNKGFHALEVHRVAHSLWTRGQTVMAVTLQSRVSQMLALDIHPAAVIGSGVLLDHGTGIVIGETARVGNNVSIMQNVTLGGTGRDVGDRHPKIGDGVLIGAGATVLGNIQIGSGAQVAAGSLVLKPVKRKEMVAGAPAQVVGLVEDGPPALSMKQWPNALDAEKACENWDNLLRSSTTASTSSQPQPAPAAPAPPTDQPSTRSPAAHPHTTLHAPPARPLPRPTADVPGAPVNGHAHPGADGLRLPASSAHPQERAAPDVVLEHGGSSPGEGPSLQSLAQDRGDGGQQHAAGTDVGAEKAGGAQRGDPVGGSVPGSGAARVGGASQSKEVKAAHSSRNAGPPSRREPLPDPEYVI